MYMQFLLVKFCVVAFQFGERYYQMENPVNFVGFLLNFS